VESRFGAAIPDDHFAEVLSLRSRRPRIKDEKINLRIESRFRTSTGNVHLTQFWTSFFEDQPWSPLVPKEVWLCWG
jgi:hypothetical protein